MCRCMLSFFSCNDTCTISVSTSKHLTFDISTILCFNWNITSWHPLQQRWTIWGDFLNHFDRITHTNKMPAQFLSVCWVYLICADRWCDHFHLFHFISSPICAIWWFNMLSCSFVAAHTTVTVLRARLLLPVWIGVIDFHVFFQQSHRMRISIPAYIHRFLFINFRSILLWLYHFILFLIYIAFISF